MATAANGEPPHAPVTAGVRERLRAFFGPGLRRIRSGWLAILQCSLGAGVAWFLAHDLIGHAQPFFAPIAAVLALGVSLGQRLSRTVQLLSGVLLGILVADVLLQLVGTGAPQLVLFVAVALVVALLFSGAQLTVNQAAVSAVLLATIAPTQDVTDQGVTRFVDALVGSLVGLAISTVLLPVNPLSIVRRASAPMFDELAGVLEGVAASLETASLVGALSSLQRARALDARLGAFDTEIDAAAELSRLAPVRRRTQPVVQRYSATVTYLDYTVRNTRVLARRAALVIQGDEAVVAELPAAVRDLAAGVHTLRRDLERDPSFAGSRARTAHTAELVNRGLERRGLSLSQQIALEQVRATALDLLRATGLTLTEAHAALGGPPAPPMSTTPPH